MPLSNAKPEQLKRWTQIGRREPNKGLMEQIDYSMSIGKKHQERLAPMNFGEEKLALMTKLYEAMKAQMSERTVALADQKQSARNEMALVSESKDFIFVLRNATPILLRGKSLTDRVPEEVLPRNSVKRSPDRILKYLIATRGLVEELNEQLTPYFGGVSALATHDRICADLSKHLAEQAAKANEAPAETIKLYQLKGALLELIEDLNRTGRIAYRGQAEVAAQFNKDILLKARRSAKGKQAEADDKAATASTTTPATPA